MRLISIVLSLTAFGFASGAIAQSPSIDRKIAQQQNAKGEYAEKAPYRPCPTASHALLEVIASCSRLTPSARYGDRGDRRAAWQTETALPVAGDHAILHGCRCFF